MLRALRALSDSRKGQTMTRHVIAALALCLGLAAPLHAKSSLRLGSLFKDHMVVQSDMKVAVWGWGQPGSKVAVALGDSKARVKAGDDGSWSVELKPVPAGGPYELTVISNADTVTVRDVLSGEVWVCSGQSNMYWPVVESANPTEEIASAKWPLIRMFSVERRFADAPQDTCSGVWEPATPEHVAHFSAVGYYFGRELHKTLGVPVGLIHTSWGGTPAEAWTTEKTLRADPDLAAIFTMAEKAKQAVQQELANFEQRQAKWEQQVQVLKNEDGVLPQRQTDTGNKGFEAGWAASDVDLTEWNEMSLPGQWEKDLGLDIDGALWFRKTVDIPESWAGRPLRVSLGAVDDFDVTYWNGEQIGSMGKETPQFWSTPRNYVVPAEQVKAGKTTIAVRVFDHWGNGGFVGAPAEMRIAPSEGDSAKTKVRLDGVWKYRVERQLPPLMPPPAPRGAAPQNEPTVLYNAMINPLLPYSIRGAIWYQGEANAGRAYQYRKLLPAMIGDWRRAWGREDLPFGIVQLANFMETTEVPTSSAWAELREAQAMTARKDENTGLAVIIDIGEADDIHPKNKQEVGRRLSLWALGTVYDRDTVYSGPRYESVSIADGKVEIAFTHVGGGLTVKGDTLTGFAIAGADSQFVWAEASVSGKNTVTVWSDKVDLPFAVRYAWADNPVCNLYNKEGLPACPFRTDEWPGTTFGKE
ncbi:MAG: 9-O-acetylesterase [Chitinivibrionales bacterium]|nr:9-O-acetylesterase [Chitinivibrionales bacterium]